MMTRSLAFLALLFSTPTYAQDNLNGFVDSVVIGAFAHEISSDDEDGVDANVEVRLRPLFGRDWAIEILPTIGATVNIDDDTNTAYLGATARYRLTPVIFVEGFFGLTVHDADTPRDADGLDLGCDVLFREGAGLGYQRGQHAVMAYISHASHGGILCDEDENDGMTSLGLRYGFNF